MIKVRPGDFLTWARHRSNYSEVSGFFPYRHYIIRFGRPKERINEQAPRTIFSASDRQVNSTTVCHQDGGICTINMVHGSTGLFLNLFSRPQGTIARLTGPPTRGRKGLAQGLQSTETKFIRSASMPEFDPATRTAKSEKFIYTISCEYSPERSIRLRTIEPNGWLPTTHSLQWK